MANSEKTTVNAGRVECPNGLSTSVQDYVNPEDGPFRPVSKKMLQDTFKVLSESRRAVE